VLGSAGVFGAGPGVDVSGGSGAGDSADSVGFGCAACSATGEGSDAEGVVSSGSEAEGALAASELGFEASAQPNSRGTTATQAILTTRS
jgi:hypothetical protein